MILTLIARPSAVNPVQAKLSAHACNGSEGKDWRGSSGIAVFIGSDIFDQEQAHARGKRARFVPVGWAGRDEYAGALGIAYASAVEVDFQFALDYESVMSLFAPMRFDEFGSEFEQAHLLRPVVVRFESGARHRGLPLQGVEDDFVRRH